MLRRLTERLARASLHFRLTALIALVVAGLIGGFAAYVAHRQALLASELLVVRARALAANVAALAQAEVAANDGVALATRLEGFNEFADLRAAAVTDRQGQPLAVVRRNAAGNLAAVPARQIARLGVPGVSQLPRAGLWMSPQPLVLWSAIGPIAPIGWVRLEYDTTPALAARDRILTDALVFALIALLFAVLAVRIILRGPVTAIRSATAFSRRLAAGRTARLEPSSRARELRELTEALNLASIRLNEEHAALLRNQAALREAGARAHGCAATRDAAPAGSGSPTDRLSAALGGPPDEVRGR
jgi:hypothetical protein